MPAWLAPALPHIIQAAGAGIGGIIGQEASDEASKFARMQFKFQRLSAKKSIQWRVKDAIAAGIHPLYALGTQPFSPSPISVSGGSPLAEGVANMGQGIGSAVQAGLSVHQTAAQRVQEALSIQNQALQNELLSGQIDALKGSRVTTVPGQGDTPAPKAPVTLRTPWGSYTRDPKKWSSAQEFQDEGGDAIENIMGLLQTLDTMWMSGNKRDFMGSAARYPLRGPNAPLR